MNQNYNKEVVQMNNVFFKRIALGGLMGLCAAQGAAQAQTVLFSDNFDDTVSNSVTDPALRATGSLGDQVKYEWYGNDSEQVQVINGLLDWIGENDSRGRLIDGTGNKVLRFKDSAGQELDWNAESELAGKRYEISFTYRSAWNHQLNFNLMDTMPTDQIEWESDPNGDFVFNEFGTVFRTATDGAGFSAIGGADGDTEYQVRLLVNELSIDKTVTVFVDDVEVTTVPISFENNSRYMTFSSTFKYGGYIDDFKVSVQMPNVIIIYSDDHGFTDLGIMGIDPNVQTPVMDDLAGDGVLFTDGYCTGPQCVPSRAGLISGRYQSRFGMRGNGAGDMPAELYTPAERFRDLGYRTGQIGKWHLGYGGSAPKDHGFDDYWNGSNRNVNRNFTIANDDPTYPDQPAQRLVEGESLKIPSLPNRCVVQGQAAEAFIDLNKDNPFFLYLAVFGPHTPRISTSDPYYLDYPAHDYPHLSDEADDVRRQGLALIKAIDDAVGGVVAKLKEHGLDENTLIFFAGDNGAQPKLWGSASEDVQKWDGSDNVPMRGEKGSLWEGGIRVPMWAHWPGVIPGGQIVSDPVISVDFMATIHQLINGTIPSEFDGVDLMPRLTMETDQVERTAPLLWDYENELAARSGDWKLRRSGAGDFLFNLREDPYELYNRANVETEIRDVLIAELDAYTDTLAVHADITKSNFADNVYLFGALPERLADERYQLPYFDNPTPTPYPAPVTTVTAESLELEAEDYDAGGQNVGYYDSTLGNFWNDYRNDDVDINETASTTFVGRVTNGEWLKYTVEHDFSDALTYTVAATFGGSHADSGDIKISVDETVVATFPVGDTGGHAKFKLSEIEGVELPAGQYHVITVEFICRNGQMSLDSFEFIPES